MIGVLIVSHGQLAAGLLDAVKVIMGAPTQTATLALNQGDSIERLRAQILQAGKNGVREFFTELRHYPAERRESND